MSSQFKSSIEHSWKTALVKELNASYFTNMMRFLAAENKIYSIYPKSSQLYNAYNLTPLHKVKVVIIGQDPYHGHGQANGLCFSVNKGISLPPSLTNIYKELVSDVGIAIPQHGNLSFWAKQGVLLLNSSLTVRAGAANSHQSIGWQKFTDATIKVISKENMGVIFLLWGGFAKKKSVLIDTSKHHILTAGHPSPLSANRGYWFGNKHFSKTNELLIKEGKKIINWQIE